MKNCIYYWEEILDGKMSETRFKSQLKDKVDSNSSIYPYAKSIYRTYCNLAGPFHTLPDFIIIGAGKAGTTSLYNYLIQHPDIYPPLRKEIKFFSNFL